MATENPAVVGGEEAPEQQQVQYASEAAAIAVQSNSQLAFNNFEMQGWKLHWSSYPMSNSTEMEAAQDQIATMGLPEVFYGNNHLYLAKPEHNFLLEICPIDACSFSSYAKREAHLRNPEMHASIEVSLNDADHKKLNVIDVIPDAI